MELAIQDDLEEHERQTEVILEQTYTEDIPILILNKLAHCRLFKPGRKHSGNCTLFALRVLGLHCIGNKKNSRVSF